MRYLIAFLLLLLSQKGFSQLCEEWATNPKEFIQKNQIQSVRIYQWDKNKKSKSLFGSLVFFKNGCLERTLYLTGNPNVPEKWILTEYKTDSSGLRFSKILSLGDSTSGWKRTEKRDYHYTGNGQLIEQGEEILNGDFLDVYSTKFDPKKGTFIWKSWTRYLGNDTLFVRKEWKNGNTGGHILSEKKENKWREKERSESVFTDKGVLDEYRIYIDGKLQQEYKASNQITENNLKDPLGYHDKDEYGLPSSDPFVYDTLKMESVAVYGLKPLPKKQNKKQYYTMVKEKDQLDGNQRVVRTLIYAPNGILLIEDHNLGDYYLAYSYKYF